MIWRSGERGSGISVLVARQDDDDYLNLARKLIKLWNMKVTVIPIAIRSRGAVTQRLIKGLENLGIRVLVEINRIAEIGQNCDVEFY